MSIPADTVAAGTKPFFETDNCPGDLSVYGPLQVRDEKYSPCPTTKPSYRDCISVPGLMNLGRQKLCLVSTTPHWSLHFKHLIQKVGYCIKRKTFKGFATVVRAPMCISDFLYPSLSWFISFMKHDNVN